MSTLCYHMFFFFNDTATTEIYTLSLHDALPIWGYVVRLAGLEHPVPELEAVAAGVLEVELVAELSGVAGPGDDQLRSEEHTSELQSRQYLVCRLLLEKKKKHIYHAKLFTTLHRS